MPWYYEMFDFLGGEYFTLLNKEKIRKARKEIQFLKDNLGLRPGQRLLDLCCGIGRHSIPLAKEGLVVTGLDHAQVLLDQARREGEEQGVSLELVAGDMASLPWQEQFDVVINMWTSFGYQQHDHEHQAILGEVHKALKPGGLFLLDVLNRDWVARNFQRGEEIREIGNITEINEYWFDSAEGRDRIRTIYIKDGEERSYQHSCRLFTYQELQSMLRQAGFEVVKGFGSFKEDPVSLENKQLVVISRKLNYHKQKL